MNQGVNNVVQTTTMSASKCARASKQSRTALHSMQWSNAINCGSSQLLPIWKWRTSAAATCVVQGTLDAKTGLRTRKAGSERRRKWIAKTRRAGSRSSSAERFAPYKRLNADSKVVSRGNGKTKKKSHTVATCSRFRAFTISRKRVVRL